MMTTLMLTLAAPVAAECAYTVLATLLSDLAFGHAFIVAMGLHLLAHWAITRHSTWTSAAETAVTVLFVDLAIHALHLTGDLPRAALHLAVVIGVDVCRRWRRRG